jgi:hypothetical protein
MAACGAEHGRSWDAAIAVGRGPGIAPKRNSEPTIELPIEPSGFPRSQAEPQPNRWAGSLTGGWICLGASSCLLHWCTFPLVLGDRQRMHHVEAAHVVREVVLRQTAILNHVNPF